MAISARSPGRSGAATLIEITIPVKAAYQM
jgi:hypothetical protein